MTEIQNQALNIRYRENPKDVVYTPIELAKKCIGLVPLENGDIVLDPAKGKGAFLNNFPENVISLGYDITEGRDFFNDFEETDWIITNPPYSLLGDWLHHSCKVAKRGFAYLIGSYSITPKRLEIIESYGFKLTHMHLCKVSSWFGMTAFCIFQKTSADNISFTYDRKVWQSDNRLRKNIEENNCIDKNTLISFLENNEE